jgi:hypothetical protein
VIETSLSRNCSVFRRERRDPESGRSHGRESRLLDWTTGRERWLI